MEAGWDILTGLASGALVVLSVVMFIFIAEGISRFVNPEYYAITLLLDLFKVQ
jgi:hypothetical protein